MSALAGRWNFDGNPNARSSCERMLAAQRAYGPHDERLWSEGPIALGRRLFRTVPEDVHDRQPLHGADGRLTLVADVRLDNRDELSDALDLSAARVREMCDAAVLLAALERWGETALDRVVGDFAFALWDSTARKLLLARDFIGHRPLHYHRGNGFVAFASMPKGLHALAEIPYAPDEQAMAEFVALVPVGDSRSFFAGIERVQAGEAVTVTSEGLTRRRYWEPERRELAGRSDDDYVEGLRHHLDQAVQSRLRGAQGAVATHLSGGFDSSAVSATAARLLAGEGGKVVAFTSVPREGYDDPVAPGRMADEGPAAAATAALYPNVEHVLIRSGDRSPFADLDRSFLLNDRPVLNPCNAVWISAINSAARERRLSVLLNAQMGNMTVSYAGRERLPELLAGARLLELWREARQLVSTGTMRWRGAAFCSVAPYLPTQVWKWFSERTEGSSDVLQYTAINSRRLEQLELARIAKERNLDFTYRPRKDGFETRLWVLRRVDLGNSYKGTLAGWGIDQRDPTADRRLVEYCLSVPMDQYLHQGKLRSLGTRALADRLPKEVLAHRLRGYQAADWHEGLTAARGEVADELERLAACAPAAETLDVERMRRLVSDWPDSGWHRREVTQAYRLALLRGISAGHFLRKVVGTNR
jgi:asparagine synthase (glutamine-hydrolysing)